MSAFARSQSPATVVSGLKRGFSYFPHEPEKEFRTRADHANELLVAASHNDDQSDTHWLRADVDQLFANAGVMPWPSDRLLAIAEFGFATNTSDQAARARALRRVAEDPELTQQEFNQAFVEMQYFAYLRRTPNSPPDRDFGGYLYWLNKLNSFNGNYRDAEMVRAFTQSIEYLGRFQR